MDDLEAMVYSVEWRRRVLKSSLLGYRRILDKARLGKTQRNWLGHETCLKSRVQKLFGKSTCLNQVKEAKETETGGRTPSVKGP